RRVSTRRATVPCASVVCSSSSRLSEVAADFELMTLSWSVRGGDGFSVSEKWNKRFRRWRCGCVPSPWLRKAHCRRALELNLGLIRSQCRNACGNGHLHALRERAPVEIGNDGAQPVEHANGV